jgi:hypothetical protein
VSKVSTQEQAGQVATVAPPQPQELVQLQQFRQLGQWLALAEADDGSPASKGAGAALRFALASQLGVNPTAALTELSFIHGRLNLSAQLVRALASKAGYRVLRLEIDDEHCVAALTDAGTGEVIGRTTYKMEDARAAGLIRAGSGWQKSPQRMLWARASKRVVDDFAPEVSLGILTPEDEAEIASEPPWEYEPEPTPATDDDVVDGELVDDSPAQDQPADSAGAGSTADAATGGDVGVEPVDPAPASEPTYEPELPAEELL